MTESEAMDFVRTSLGSVWALELLVLLGGERERSWRLEEIVRESRSSSAAVSHALLLLEAAGLIAKTNAREYRYQPSSPELDTIGELVRKIYSTKPTTVIAAMFESPNHKLREFAQAFKFKE